jgi:DNA-binding response OmpR family regulator
MDSQNEPTGKGAPRRAEVLVVDDMADARAAAVRIVGDQGWQAAEAVDGRSALAALARSRFDLVILDLGLPDMPGRDVLTEIRRASDTPVIVVTGLDDENVRVDALLGGADDYVTKPFSARELVARATAVLRRARLAGPGRVEFGSLVIDFDEERAFVDGVDRGLRPREFALLACLAGEPRRVFSTDALLRAVWRSNAEWQDAATVGEHVRRLRRRIEADPTNPRWILSRRGSGYWFED